MHTVQRMSADATSWKVLARRWVEGVVGKAVTVSDQLFSYEWNVPGVYEHQTCLRAILSPQFGVNNIYVKNQITTSQPPSPTHKATGLNSCKWKYVGALWKGWIIYLVRSWFGLWMNSFDSGACVWGDDGILSGTVLCIKARDLST